MTGPHPDIAVQRLANQGISPGGPATVLGVVRRMGAMQAQDYAGTLWAVALRAGLDEASVVAAFERRAVLRTWPQRGTIHLVPSTDARWLVGIAAQRTSAALLRQRARLGLSDALMAAAADRLAEALADDRMLTRPQVTEVLEAAGVAGGDGRAYVVIRNLAQAGLLYMGPMAGRQQTFGLLGSLPGSDHPEPREPLRELARRYFVSHGPATVADFVRWTGLTAGTVRAAIEASHEDLECRTVAGQAYWGPKQAAPVPAGDQAYLLPGFDEYILGYRDRSAVLAADHANRLVPGANGVFLGTIVVNGQVRGTWKRANEKGRVVLLLDAFEPLSRREVALLDAPAAAYERFAGRPVELRWR